MTPLFAVENNPNPIKLVLIMIPSRLEAAVSVGEMVLFIWFCSSIWLFLMNLLQIYFYEKSITPSHSSRIKYEKELFEAKKNK